MATSRLCLRLMLLLALLLLPALAGAAAPAAKNAAILGSASGNGYVNPGRRSFTAGMPLRANDQIVLRSGKLSLRMSDGTTIKLAGPAEFTIETTQDASGRSVFQVSSGRVFVKTRQRAGGEVRVVTPSATLAVRGSSGGVDASAASSLCWCAEGLVYVDAGGERVALNPGYQTTVQYGGPPPPPTPMGEDTLTLNEQLNLGASLNQTPNNGLLLGPGQPPGMRLGSDRPVTEDQVAARSIAAAESVLRDLFQAYELEDMGAVMGGLATGFNTSDEGGFASNLATIEESLRQDFTNLDNIRFFRQPTSSSRYYSDRDQVSLRERWIMNAILPNGARFEQGGETVFLVGADAGGGGWRVLRWEGDSPFGRYHALQETMPIGAPTVLTPAAPGSARVVLSGGTMERGGDEITGAQAQVFATVGGSTVRVDVSGGDISFGSQGEVRTTNATLSVNVDGQPIRGSGVVARPDGSLQVQDASFTVNGVALTADSLTMTSVTNLAPGSFVATGVSFNLGGIIAHAAGMELVGNPTTGYTVLLTNVVVTDAHGNTVTLATATIQPPSGSGPPVLTGTTSTGQTVTATSGGLVIENPPGVPLQMGRGERITADQGFKFATEAVTDGPADLYLSGGKLIAVGVLDLGPVAFHEVTAAPATGYTTQLTVNEALAMHVLVVQTEAGRYAKLLVRAGTTPTQLYFDWVHNAEGGLALSRARRWPTRAAISYNAKVYNNSASGDTRLAEGAQSMAEVRVQHARNLNNGGSIEVYLAPRLSSDRGVDNKAVNMDRFGVKYFRPNDFEVSLGDISSQFTPYSLNQSLLGLQAWRNFSMGPAGTARLMATIGPRWRPGSNFQFDGWVAGFRLATEEIRDLGPLLEDMVVGLNFVRSRKGKHDSNTYQSSAVFSMDATMRFHNGLSLMGEWAHSRGEANSLTQKGDALLLRGAYRVGPFRFILDRERVGSHFTTLSGTAASDQVRTNAWVRYRPNEWFSANYNLLHTEDNLDRSKAFTTRMNVPRYGISVAPFYPLLRGGFLRNLTLDALLSINMRDSDDDARTVDKKYRTLSLSALQRMGEFTLTVGRDEERDLDYAATGLSRRGHANDVSLRWRPRHHFLPIAVSPVFGIRRQKDTYTRPAADPVQSLVTSRRFGLDLGDDSSLGVELGYELLDNHRPSDLGGYNRRVLNVDLTRALDREGNRTAGISYRLLRNRQENGARSYTEGQVTGSLKQEF